MNNNIDILGDSFDIYEKGSTNNQNWVSIKVDENKTIVVLENSSLSLEEIISNLTKKDSYGIQELTTNDFSLVYHKVTNRIIMSTNRVSYEKFIEEIKKLPF